MQSPQRPSVAQRAARVGFAGYGSSGDVSTEHVHSRSSSINIWASRSADHIASDRTNQFVSTCKGTGVDKGFGYCVLGEARVKLAPAWVEGDVYTVSLWTYMEPTDQLGPFALNVQTIYHTVSNLNVQLTPGAWERHSFDVTITRVVARGCGNQCANGHGYLVMGNYYFLSTASDGTTTTRPPMWVDDVALVKKS